MHPCLAGMDNCCNTVLASGPNWARLQLRPSCCSDSASWTAVQACNSALRRLSGGLGRLLCAVSTHDVLPASLHGPRDCCILSRPPSGPLTAVHMVRRRRSSTQARGQMAPLCCRTCMPWCSCSCPCLAKAAHARPTPLLTCKQQISNPIVIPDPTKTLSLLLCSDCMRQTLCTALLGFCSLHSEPNGTMQVCMCHSVHACVWLSGLPSPAHLCLLSSA